MFLQVLKDLLHIPAAAEIVADDRVKQVAAVGCFSSTTLHNELDLVDGIAAAIDIAGNPIAVRMCRCRGLAALAPNKSPVNYVVDIAELTDGTIKRIAGDGECLVSTAEQLGRNGLAVDLKREFAV